MIFEGDADSVYLKTVEVFSRALWCLLGSSKMR